MGKEHEKDTLAPPRGVANVYDAPTLDVDMANDESIRKLLEQARRADARQPSGLDFAMSATAMRPATSLASASSADVAPKATAATARAPSHRASNAATVFALVFAAALVVAFATTFILR